MKAEDTVREVVVSKEQMNINLDLIVVHYAYEEQKRMLFSVVEGDRMQTRIMQSVMTPQVALL